MAVFPDKIVLKNSFDDRATIEAAIAVGGSDEIQRGELVVGLENGAVRLYSLDAANQVVDVSGSAYGRAIVSSSMPDYTPDGQALFEGYFWFNPNDESLHVYSSGAWVQVSGGGGGGAVTSVNGQTGAVVLGLGDIENVSTDAGLGQAPSGFASFDNSFELSDPTPDFEPPGASYPETGGYDGGRYFDATSPQSVGFNTVYSDSVAAGDYDIISFAFRGENYNTNNSRLSFGTQSFDATAGDPGWALRMQMTELEFYVDGSQYDTLNMSGAGLDDSIWNTMLVQLYWPSGRTAMPEITLWVNNTRLADRWTPTGAATTITPSTAAHFSTVFALRDLNLDSIATVSQSSEFLDPPANATIDWDAEHLRILNSSESVTPSDGQVLTWVDANNQWEPVTPSGGGGSTTLDSLTDVSVPSPSTNEILAWDGSAWTAQAFGDNSYSSNHGDLTQFPLHGLDGFYADQAALEADGFTFIAGSANADDMALTFSPGASWDGLSFLGQSLSSANWFMNSNGGVGFDGNGHTTNGRSGNSITASADIDLYVSWWSQDSETRLAGYKEVTIDGTDWLIVRADMKVPYNSETNGFPVEAWFSKKGEISVRYGTSVNGAVITVSPTANVICGNGSVYPYTSAPFIGLTSSGAYGVSYSFVPGISISLDSLSDVDATTTLPTDGQVLTWVDANGQWEPADASGGGGGGGGARVSVSAATSSIADQAIENVTVASTGKAGNLLAIETDQAAWVTIYSDQASRTADTGRGESTSPSAGSGIIAEVITTGAERVKVTPCINYFNDEAVPVSELYLKVVNKSGSTQVITTTLTVVPTES